MGNCLSFGTNGTSGQILLKLPLLARSCQFGSDGSRSACEREAAESARLPGRRPVRRPVSTAERWARVVRRSRKIEPTATRCLPEKNKGSASWSQSPNLSGRAKRNRTLPPPLIRSAVRIADQFRSGLRKCAFCRSVPRYRSNRPTMQKRSSARSSLRQHEWDHQPGGRISRLCVIGRGPEPSPLNRGWHRRTPQHLNLGPITTRW